MTKEQYERVQLAIRLWRLAIWSAGEQHVMAKKIATSILKDVLEELERKRKG